MDTLRGAFRLFQQRRPSARRVFPAAGEGASDARGWRRDRKPGHRVLMDPVLVLPATAFQALRKRSTKTMYEKPTIRPTGLWGGGAANVPVLVSTQPTTHVECTDFDVIGLIILCPRSMSTFAKRDRIRVLANRYPTLVNGRGSGARRTLPERSSHGLTKRYRASNTILSCSKFAAQKVSSSAVSAARVNTLSDVVNRSQ